MSPSCRTMPPIICTSKMRWSESRRRASRTAANASNKSSSSSSPFSRRCLNSAVFARSSESESLRNSGSKVATYAPCSARRFARRPSPKRRAFSSVPIAGTSTTGYRLRFGGSPLEKPPLQNRHTRLQSSRLSLPEVALEAARADDELGRLGGAEPLERGRRAEDRPAVDVQPVSRPRHHELGFVASEPRYRHHRDARSADRPGVAAPAHGLCPVRRPQARFDRVRQRPERIVGLVLLDEQGAVVERDEVYLVSREPRRQCARDDVPAPCPRHPVDAWLAALPAVPAGR